MKLTCWDLFSWIDSLKQVDCKVHHVRLPRELILGYLDLLGREESRLGEVREERKRQVSVQIWNDLLREVPLGHGCQCFFGVCEIIRLDGMSVPRSEDFFYQTQPSCCLIWKAIASGAPSSHRNARERDTQVIANY